jgi:beta-galactosidase
VGAAAAQSIARYVESGGHLLVTYFSGIVDEHAQVRPGGYPGAFRNVLGIRVEEFYPTASVVLESGARGRWWSELVSLDGASAVDTYADGPLTGEPAITRHEYGEGVAWYVSTQLESADYAQLFESVTSGASLTRPDVPEGVELVTRRGDSTRWTFAINHTTQPVDVGSLVLPPGGHAVLSSTL